MLHVHPQALGGRHRLNSTRSVGLGGIQTSLARVDGESRLVELAAHAEKPIQGDWPTAWAACLAAG